MPRGCCVPKESVKLHVYGADNEQAICVCLCVSASAKLSHTLCGGATQPHRDRPDALIPLDRRALRAAHSVYDGHILRTDRSERSRQSAAAATAHPRRPNRAINATRSHFGCFVPRAAFHSIRSSLDIYSRPFCSCSFVRTGDRVGDLFAARVPSRGAQSLPITQAKNPHQPSLGSERLMPPLLAHAIRRSNGPNQTPPQRRG